MRAEDLVLTSEFRPLARSCLADRLVPHYPPSTNASPDAATGIPAVEIVRDGQTFATPAEGGQSHGTRLTLHSTNTSPLQRHPTRPQHWDITYQTCTDRSTEYTVQGRVRADGVQHGAGLETLSCSVAAAPPGRPSSWRAHLDTDFRDSAQGCVEASLHHHTGLDLTAMAGYDVVGKEGRWGLAAKHGRPNTGSLLLRAMHTSAAQSHVLLQLRKPLAGCATWLSSVTLTSADGKLAPPSFRMDVHLAVDPSIRIRQQF